MLMNFKGHMPHLAIITYGVKFNRDEEERCPKTGGWDPFEERAISQLLGHRPGGECVEYE